MQLREALIAAGMTPPHHLIEGKWLRFPGVGKGRSNRAGWCRLISPTLAIYGDWSSGLSEIWRDATHQETAASREALWEARRREVEFLRTQRSRQAQVAHAATVMIEKADLMKHPYLARKGFPDELGLVKGEKLLVPMHDVGEYHQLINVQEITEDGTKRFLAGGRARGAIHRIGSPKPIHTVLCEGYATGLSLASALRMLSQAYAVIVCFSAHNLEVVAQQFPCAVVAADNDRSATGERAAQATGLKWTMPYEVGTDFNDLHINMGLFVVVDRLRQLLLTH